jgi:hypothetical protein
MHKLLARLAVGVLAVGAPLGLVAATSPAAGAATATLHQQTHPAAVTLAASSESNCAANSSNNNCNGVWISQTGPCWTSSYVVKPNNGGVTYWGSNGYQFETDLRYSTTCHSNFSVTTMVQWGIGLYHYSGKVRRYAGKDGGYLMEHGGWLTAGLDTNVAILSPLVYSPDNVAQACGSNNDSDQVSCTAKI